MMRTALALLLLLPLAGCIDEPDEQRFAPATAAEPDLPAVERTDLRTWLGDCSQMVSVGAADDYAPAVHGVGSLLPDDRPENLTKLVLTVAWNSTTDVADQERIGIYVHYADRSFDPKASLMGAEGDGVIELVVPPDVWVAGSELEMTLHASLDDPVAAQVQCTYTVTAAIHWTE